MDTSLLRRTRRLVVQDLAVADLCLALDGELRGHVAYGAAAWSTHDPGTGLSTGCTLSGVPVDPEREVAIFRHEFVEDEPATYIRMIAEGRTVTRLSEETNGDLHRAGRWREVFSHFGVSDELRAILWADGRAWGSLSAYRMDGETFTEADAALVAEVGPVVADGLRRCLLRAAASRPAAVADPPGILEVDLAGDVSAVTEPALAFLERGGDALRSAARVAAAAIQQHDDWPAAGSRVVVDDGTALALHASGTRRGDGSVAVIVEAARPAQVAAMLVDAYGLTPRQREVIGLLLLGRSMVQIARELEISEHTANDHRKAIYERVGVASRAELAAHLQAEQYDPRARAGATPSPYGGFLI